MMSTSNSFPARKLLSCSFLESVVVDVSAQGSGCSGASGMPSWMTPHAAAPTAAVAAVPPSSSRFTAVDDIFFFSFFRRRNRLPVYMCLRCRLFVYTVCFGTRSPTSTDDARPDAWAAGKILGKGRCFFAFLDGSRSRAVAAL